MKLPFKGKSPTLPQYWEVMVEVWPAWDHREERGGTDGGRASQRKGSRTDRRRGRWQARNMPNFEGNWKMKSSLNFEELLKALGEFCDLILKCHNKQFCCPLNCTWITYNDPFINKINLKKCLLPTPSTFKIYKYRSRFLEYVWFSAEFKTLLSSFKS